MKMGRLVDHGVEGLEVGRHLRQRDVAVAVGIVQRESEVFFHRCMRLPAG